MNKTKAASSKTTPKVTPDEHNESWHQKQLIQWCRQFPWGQFLFHVPNETTGGPSWVVRNRQMGCKKGVPDLMLPVPMGDYHGLFIEMKRPGGRMDEYQRRWNAALKQFGYLAICCYGWEEAKDVLLGYMAQINTGEQTDGISEVIEGRDNNGLEGDL